MRQIFAVSAFVLSLGAANAAEPPPETLQGDWQVVGVSVADSPVQALATDDPAYMGAVLNIAADSLIWTKGTKTRPIDPAIDNCAADPLFDDMDGNYFVTCAGAPWGPGDEGGVIRQVNADEITLIWYDGGQLTLQRQP